MSATVVVSGAAVLLPGADSVQALVAGPASSAEAVSPADVVGRKGLRYKDRATQIGYALALRALTDAGLLGEDGTTTVPAGSVGVVASSNFGNLDTVTRALDTIREETVNGTSPMDLPNASSNVIASSVAIRYGLRGPNLMVCNGPTSGLDAVHWAATMIEAGRAERMLVLGVEPDNEVVRKLTGGRPAVDGGAAIVVERADAVAERGGAVRAVLGGYARTAAVADLLERLASSGAPVRWEVPAADPPAEDLLPGVPRSGLPEHSGEPSGALGVLQCAAAVGWFEDGGAGPVYALSGGESADASAGLVLLAPGAA
ncbi:beta-ketoacyl synthase N-terminal-like domain-containing protein [Streptomyces sp. NRRL WC-3742]|uniref:beta-ketoacyl synthase N-terminal-like domain-containing protein n=1 Tax=Streptomyces sp. NRRL WC-3742 TaxID=1463934 RepID=UPI0004CBF637|nr:beta-ketoacyl synthase N-terminal-like domain-containing protein [Streptomyces sp. NRRL WC-3742]